MAFGSNATIKRSIKIYPTVSGSTMLLEYRGSHFDVVAFDVIATRSFPTLLGSMTIAAINGVTLSQISNFTLNDAIQAWQMSPTVIRFCNINGIAHIIVPTNGLIGGDVVQASATVIE